jgi:hypothetical protein
MDGLHFDRVVKSLVARGPRRSMLGALTSVALAPMAALLAPHRALAVGGSCTLEAARVVQRGDSVAATISASARVAI